MSPNPNNCEEMPGWHRFFQVKEVSFYEPGRSGTMRADNIGVRIVCGICGEIREVWDDGDIDIIKSNPHAKTSNPEN